MKNKISAAENIKEGKTNCQMIVIEDIQIKENYVVMMGT